MNAVEKIEQVLASNLLMSDLLVLPGRGASEAEIRAESAALGRSLSDEFTRFLTRWNGLNLEVLVLFGCEGTHPEIPCLRHRQTLVPAGQGVAIGSDPAGFVFVEMPTGQVVSVDTKSGEQAKASQGFDEFICRRVFGEDADRFGGDDWREELRVAGLLL